MADISAWVLAIRLALPCLPASAAQGANSCLGSQAAFQERWIALTTAWHRCQRLVEQRLVAQRHQPAHRERTAALAHATHPFDTARLTPGAGAAVPILPGKGGAVGGSESREAAVAAVRSGDGGGAGRGWRGDESEDARVRRNALKLMEASDGLLSFARARLPPPLNQGNQVAERLALLLI